jgi:hypothetical protein
MMPRAAVQREQRLILSHKHRGPCGVRQIEEFLIVRIAAAVRRLRLQRKQPGSCLPAVQAFQQPRPLGRA